jgi:hypothetical protein
MLLQHQNGPTERKKALMLQPWPESEAAAQANHHHAVLPHSTLCDPLLPHTQAQAASTSTSAANEPAGHSNLNSVHPPST